MKKESFALFALLLAALVLLSGCTSSSDDEEVPIVSLEEAKNLFGACEGEYKSLLNLIDNESKTPLEKAEGCKKIGKGIGICLEKIIDFNEDNLLAHDAEAYLEGLKYDLLNSGGALSSACACANTARHYDSKIENEFYASGKQLLRVEKFCKMKEECEKLMEFYNDSTAVEKIPEFSRDSPLNFYRKSTTKDFVDYCTTMVEDLEGKISAAAGEEKEALEIEWAYKILYCNENAISGNFFEENIPDWMVILGRGKNKEATDMIEKYEAKYEIKFSGDEFNCPSIQFKLGLKKKTETGATEPGAGSCDRASMDSCAAAGGTIDQNTCECKKNAAVDCTQLCSALGREAADANKANLEEGCKKEGAIPALCTLLPAMSGKSFSISVFIDKEAGCCCKSVSSSYGPSSENCWEIGSATQHSESANSEYWTFPYSSLPCDVASPKITLGDCNGNV